MTAKTSVRLLLAAMALGAAVRGTTAWGDNTVDPRVVVTNPNWNITITDFGYSDWLYDNTPGFEGREYLSGEWAAAVGYIRAGTVVNPTWLEPGFSYPDWTTNSNFTASQHIAITGQNFGGLDAQAASQLTNNDLKIDISYVMVDTVTGMAMGNSPASAGTGISIESNRYVLKQTYTITNTSGEAMTNLNFFQFLHSLEATKSVYDNRLYAGTMSSYRYDITQTGVSIATSALDGSTSSLMDYISFGASITPTAVTNGWYGIDAPLGTDNHGTGMPSVGVHLDIQNLKLDVATASTLSTVDQFSPGQGWVAGAEQFKLGSLAAGASTSIDFLLSVKTGTVITPPTGGGGGGGGGIGGSANGGSICAGGVDFNFEDLKTAGSFFAEYSKPDAGELAERIAEKEFGPVLFELPGGGGQLYELEFDGAFNGDVQLTFGYSDTPFAAGFDENSLHIFHYSGGTWHDLGGVVDPLNNTITVTTSSLSPFMLGVGAVPEPASAVILAAGCGILLTRRRKMRR